MNFKEFKENYQKIPPEEYPYSVQDDILVSICIQTYQHADYIEECLEGILNQKTTFKFELLLGEDASTDGTREICLKYAKKFPEKIRLFLHSRENNIKIDGVATGRFNFLYNLYSAKGEFIALCEGDDYWVDPFKLQKQVDFLQNNKDFVLVFHNVKIFNTRGSNQSSQIMHKNLGKDVFQTKDLLKQWFIPTASIVFRNKNVSLPRWFVNCGSADIPLMLLLSLLGKFKYLEDIMAVYRMHDRGLSIKHQGYSKVFAMIFIYQNFNIYTNSEFHKEINEAMIYEIRKHLPEARELKILKKRSIKEKLKKILSSFKSLYF